MVEAMRANVHGFSSSVLIVETAPSSGAIAATMETNCGAKNSSVWLP